MYLLDTNILSELVKKNPNNNLMIRLESIPSASLYTASICVMELRYGVLRRGNPSDLWSKIEKSILSKVQILNFYYKDALKAAEVLSELHSIYCEETRCFPRYTYQFAGAGETPRTKSLNLFLTSPKIKE